MKIMELTNYQIDPVRGFLPALDPLTSLNNPYFSPWEDTVSRLPKLLGTRRIRYFINKLPSLDPARLRNLDEVNRAMTLLSYLGHAYIWGEDAVEEHLPANIAVPWYKVAEVLGRPPILSYVSHALYNWRLIERDQPIELGNLERIENFYGAIDEDWFVLVHVGIEAKAGPAVGKLVQAQQAVARRSAPDLLDALRQLCKSLTEMVAVLHRMPENCDPYVYYQKIRRYIFGWINPALPNGVYYDGVREWENQPQKFRGETGAQSSIIPAIDALLGIRFDQTNVFYRHLIELRDYMPPLHRKFIEDLEGNSIVAPLRDFIVSVQDTVPELASIYDAVLGQNYLFRKAHFQYAREYINKQDQRNGKSPRNLGTGGTPFIEYLEQHLKDVLAAKIRTSGIMSDV